jgi:hypothetical protein
VRDCVDPSFFHACTDPIVGSIATSNAGDISWGLFARRRAYADRVGAVSRPRRPGAPVGRVVRGRCPPVPPPGTTARTHCDEDRFWARELGSPAFNPGRSAPRPAVGQQGSIRTSSGGRGSNRAHRQLPVRRRAGIDCMACTSLEPPPSDARRVWVT